MSETHHHHGHDHDHAHDHAGSATMAQRVATLVGALERKGIVTADQLDRTVEGFLAHCKPANGAAVVARAWVDPAFKGRVLADANAAIEELGFDMSHWAYVKLRAVENTARVHNVIVCTLCSCYPLSLLGPSPTWYKSVAYRSRVVRDPRGVLEEFGVHLDPGVEIRVWDSTAELRYIVLPQRPAGTETLTESELAELVTRDSMIGTGVCEAPRR
ncbi:MAG TPA: nitrile hydratase subunit alpha [Candidatus Dormibacteraeota bacterium]|nr:nitrile hydratase subunit alpha [Candidatus Dormibacteraeota bacterium]